MKSNDINQLKKECDLYCSYFLNENGDIYNIFFKNEYIVFERWDGYKLNVYFDYIIKEDEKFIITGLNQRGDWRQEILFIKSDMEFFDDPKSVIKEELLKLKRDYLKTKTRYLINKKEFQILPRFNSCSHISLEQSICNLESNLKKLKNEIILKETQLYILNFS